MVKYRNPVIPGFYPDPSLCRVGDDFYLVNSSFEYFPGVPLSHSRDLVNWRQIGHCLTRKSQLPLTKVHSSEGIYAPTIRHHDGTFYMVTTNVSAGGHFYVSTEDPAGEWSEPIWVDQEGIDPSLFFDDDGKVYFTSTGSGENRDGCIVQSEIDIRTGKLLSKLKTIWEGTGGQYPEAPHLYKIEGMYYLMISEGGTDYGHMVTIARSKSPWGPFEGCPHNPILTHRSTSSPIQNTGHGDLVQAADGSWWIVFLGVRPSYLWHHLGRETFLAPVSWKDGWPVVGEDGMVLPEMNVKGLKEHPWPAEAERDDFEDEVLRPCWNFIRNPKDEDWSLTERPGWLRLRGSGVTLNDRESPAFVGRRQQHFDCEVSTLLDFDPQGEAEEAGLVIRMNEEHHYEIGVRLMEGSKRVVVRRRIGSLAAGVATEQISEGLVRLFITANRDTYSFACSPENGTPLVIAEAETRYLSKEVAGGFTGVYFGMYATGSGQRTTVPAYFDWFDYKPLAEALMK